MYMVCTHFWLISLQFAGKHLSQLQKSIKGGNFGTLLSEGIKRGKRYSKYIALSITCMCV